MIMPNTDKVDVGFRCTSCGQAIIVRVSEEGLAKYKKGGLVQDCFPELDAGSRELFITGICSECFDKMFSEE